jgi:hypothetical protein
MKQRIISFILLLVLMIIVVHNAMPHHHHVEILMHDHDVHDDDADAHSGKDHEPVKCVIQNIDFNVPKALSNVKCATPAFEVDYFISTIGLLLFADSWFTASFIEIPPGDPPLQGIIPAIPPRAPPC